MADMSRSGLFMDLTDAVQADPRIAWADIMSYFRDTAAYAGRIMAVPLVWACGGGGGGGAPAGRAGWGRLLARGGAAGAARAALWGGSPARAVRGRPWG